MANIFRRVYRFYYEGFRSMTVGRKLWILIIFKAVVLLLLMKILFFPDILERDYDTDDQRAEAVRTRLAPRR